MLFESLRRRLSVLRLRPFETTTEAGRASERYRRASLAAIAAVLAKLTTALVVLVTTPLVLDSLGAELFGVWATISSFMAVLAFTDLGVGNGLINAISRAYGEDDQRAARSYFASAIALLAGVGGVFLGAAVLANELGTWSAVFNASPAYEDEIRRAMAVYVVCFAVGLPLGAVAKTQTGYQEGASNNVCMIVGSLVSLLGIILAVHLDAGLSALVLALMSAPLVGNGINAAILLRMRPYLMPALDAVAVGKMKTLLKTGALFFLLQLATAAAFASDNIVITRLFGADQVASFAVPWRLFSLSSMVVGVALAPLWPAYGEAIARNDGRWIRATFRKTLALSLVLSTAVAGFLFLSGPFILRLWVGDRVTIDGSLLLSMGALSVALTLATPLSIYLNGTGKIGVQAVLGVLMAAIAIGLKIVLGQRFGLVAVPLSTAGSLFCVTIVPLLFYTRALIGQQDQAKVRT